MKSFPNEFWVCAQKRGNIQDNSVSNVFSFAGVLSNDLVMILNFFFSQIAIPETSLKRVLGVAFWVVGYGKLDYMSFLFHVSQTRELH